MDKPKFKVGKKVKFHTDPDGMGGVVKGFSYNSESGFIYTITSRYFDKEINDMVEGQKICREDELVEVKEKKDK